MQIRKAVIQDARGIATLEEQTFTVPWSYDAISKDLENPVATYIVAEQEGEIIGYVGVWCVVDEGQITNVAVHKDYRRQGIAKALVEALVQYAKEHKLYSLLLEVRESNTAAIHLYQSSGFEKAGKRKKYYTQPAEDAWIMIKQM